MSGREPVEFLAVDAPLVSVVVLGWRLPEHLVTSLRALSRQQVDGGFEAIVVLNGADRAVRDAVTDTVVGASVIVNPVNIGFGGACNRGASAARGRYVAFLSDDALVPEGWLDACVAAFRRHPDAGAIASVLINADGSVQEAGVRMMAEGHGIPLGAGVPVEEIPDLLEERTIDYGSGAALVVRTDVFRELGGFDLRFYPAYYEDSDLAFRIRASGRRIVLQPSRRVGHLGRASSVDSGEYQRVASERGRMRFLERWREDLPPRGAEPDPASGGGDLSQPPRVIRVDGLDRVDELASEVGALRALVDWDVHYVAELNSTILEERRMHGELLRRAERAESRADEEAALARSLRARVDDIESRGPFGLARMWVGSRVARRRRIIEEPARPQTDDRERDAN